MEERGGVPVSQTTNTRPLRSRHHRHLEGALFTLLLLQGARRIKLIEAFASESTVILLSAGLAPRRDILNARRRCCRQRVSKLVIKYEKDDAKIETVASGLHLYLMVVE
jgi:hypothetical protein